VSHDYRVIVIGFGCEFGVLWTLLFVVSLVSTHPHEERETEQWLSEGKRLSPSGKKQEVFKQPLLLVSLFSLAVSLICEAE